MFVIFVQAYISRFYEFRVIHEVVCTTGNVPCYPTYMRMSIYESLPILTFRESVSRKGYFFQTTSVDSSRCTWTGSGVLGGPIQDLATGVIW